MAAIFGPLLKKLGRKAPCLKLKPRSQQAPLVHSFLLHEVWRAKAKKKSPQRQKTDPGELWLRLVTGDPRSRLRLLLQEGSEASTTGTQAAVLLGKTTPG